VYQYERLRNASDKDKIRRAGPGTHIVTIRAMSVNIDLRVYTGNNVLLPGSQVPRAATVLLSIKTGKIIDVREGRHVRADYADIIASSDDDDRWTDVGDKYILPGLVEYVRSLIITCTTCSVSSQLTLSSCVSSSAHVHLNEPGRTDWEGFWTGTRAAASGGITTVVDMPLNSIPPTTTVENLAAKRSAAREQCWTDVAFWGGVIPGNQVRNFRSIPILFYLAEIN
jgi:allantoinase